MNFFLRRKNLSLIAISKIYSQNLTFLLCDLYKENLYCRLNKTIYICFYFPTKKYYWSCNLLWVGSIKVITYIPTYLHTYIHTHTWGERGRTIIEHVWFGKFIQHNWQKMMMVCLEYLLHWRLISKMGYHQMTSDLFYRRALWEPLWFASKMSYPILTVQVESLAR